MCKVCKGAVEVQKVQREGVTPPPMEVRNGHQRICLSWWRYEVAGGGVGGEGSDVGVVIS